MEPRSGYYMSQGLRIHYVCWGDPRLPPVLLIHGGRDHARNWDDVAAGLIDRFAVYAVDLRGHGDSEWSIGSQYSVPEFVVDIAAFADHLNRDPLPVVGHSLGGGIALQYAGVFPERVSRVCAIEGLGPGISKHRPASERMQEYVQQIRDFERRQPRHYRTLDDAIARMREANPHLTPGMARHLTVHGARRHEDGSYTWKFDNYVRLHSPYEFNMEDAREIWNQIRQPVLFIRGDESWAADPEKDGKAAAFHSYRSVQIHDAGHWVHHDQLDVFMAELNHFLDADLTPNPSPTRGGE
ncbi:MAG: alpha/beta hydrolase [Chloroflexi bacterium]|nr:alpha/beta hydrolase [Chloroflexota bacterium]